jgi:hypothetical protein
MAWSQFVPVDHGDYAIGNTNANTHQLRFLWDNVLLLAGDAGTGYGSNPTPADTAYPFGYALAAMRRPVLWRCDQDGAVRAHNVDYLQQLAIKHTKPMLYYRGKSVELVYVDDTGEEVARALDDYDVTLGYSAFDLTNIDELIDGDVYFLRVKLVHDAFENVDESTAWLDWATEEDW